MARKTNIKATTPAPEHFTKYGLFVLVDGRLELIDMYDTPRDAQFFLECWLEKPGRYNKMVSVIPLNGVRK